MAGYFQRLCEAIGQAWNRFWFTPADPCTLSVLRVLVGLLATFSIFTYSFDLDFLFGPAGILPSDLVRSLLESRSIDDGRFRFSFLDNLHSSRELWAFHLISLGVLALFTIGCFARVTSILALVVVLSYAHRALFLTSEFEGVLAFLMFYICFGPSGAYFSVDSWLARRKQSGAAQPVAASYSAAISLRLIQVHLSVVYIMMVLGQLSAPVWWNGQAAWWLALNTQDALVDLTGLRSHLLLFNAWTHAIVAFELLFPLLVRKPLARPLMLALGVIVWSSVAVLTGLVCFCLLMMVANLAFVPGDEMRHLGAALRAGRDSPVPTPAQ